MGLNQIIFYFDFKLEFNKRDYLIFSAQSKLDSAHQRRHWREAESQEKGERKDLKKQRALCALMSVKKNHEITNLPFPDVTCEARLPCELKGIH